MKKRFFYAICVMALATAVAIVSCKKEKQDEATEKRGQSAQSITKMDEAMMAFGERMKSASGSGDAMPLEEAVRTLSNYQNFLFCDASCKASEMVCDAFEVELPVHDGMVQLGDLHQLFETNRAKIRFFYDSFSGAEKRIFSIASEVTGEADDVQSVRVKTSVWMQEGAVREKPNPNYTILFDSTDYWKDFCWAGKCGDYEGQHIGEDALSQLQSKLREWLPLPSGPTAIYFTDPVEVVDVATNHPDTSSPNGLYAMPYVVDTNELNCVTPEGMLYYYNYMKQLYQSYARYYGKTVTDLSVLQNYIINTPSKTSVLYLKLKTVNYTGFERERP